MLCPSSLTLRYLKWCLQLSYMFVLFTLANLVPVIPLFLVLFQQVLDLVVYLVKVVQLLEVSYSGKRKPTQVGFTVDTFALTSSQMFCITWCRYGLHRTGLFLNIRISWCLAMAEFSVKRFALFFCWRVCFACNGWFYEYGYLFPQEVRHVRYVSQEFAVSAKLAILP